MWSRSCLALALVVVASLAACGGASSSSSIAATITPPVTAREHGLIVLELTATAQACGVAGDHAALAIDGQRDRRIFYVHAGGDGQHLDGAALHAWYVAEIALFGELRALPADRCLDALPSPAGEVVRMWRVADEAEARALATAGPPARAPDYDASPR